MTNSLRARFLSFEAVISQKTNQSNTESFIFIALLMLISQAIYFTQVFINLRTAFF